MVKIKNIFVTSHKSQVTSSRLKVKFLVLTCSFAFCLLPFAFPCFAADKIVAVVNNDIITQRDLDDFVNFMRVQLSREYAGNQLEDKVKSLKADLLDRLIEDRLILQEAKKNDIKIDEKRVKEKLAEIKKRYSSDVEFQNALSQQGLVVADIEARIREQLLMYSIVDAKIRNNIIVNPGEITDFYYKNSKDFITPEQREFDSINAESPEVARDVCNKLKNGEQLIDLVIKYALKINKLSVQQGEELRKDIETAVFNLKEGQISSPIEIDGSYYIFRLNAINPPRQQTLEETKDAIFNYLFNKKMQEGLVKWLDELRKQSYIKIMQE